MLTLFEFFAGIGGWSEAALMNALNFTIKNTIMTLSFKTSIDGQPTYFVQKIWAGLFVNKDSLQIGIIECTLWLNDCINNGHFDRSFLTSKGIKIHTIRADTKNRWRLGMSIHFVIKNRTPQRFQFAPTIPVKAIQEIYIRWSGAVVYVYLDGKVFYTNLTNEPEMLNHRMLFLAKNDGFDSIEAFLQYFNSDFKGKIIHWTDFTYIF